MGEIELGEPSLYGRTAKSAGGLARQNRLKPRDLAGWSQPADETGGDCFDFIPLPEQRLALAVADATGHGIGPALIISETRALLRALAEPARLIAANAGSEGAVVVERIRAESGSTGFNAATGEWVDLMKAGIIDPAKVTRSALQNAASIAALVLTTESAVVEKPEDEPEPAGTGGHGHMH